MWQAAVEPMWKTPTFDLRRSFVRHLPQSFHRFMIVLMRQHRPVCSIYVSLILHG